MTKEVSFTKKRNLIVFCVLIIGILVILLNASQVVLMAETTKHTNVSDTEENCVKIRDSYCSLLENQITSYKKQLTSYTNADIINTGTPDEIEAWIVAHPKLHSSDFEYVAYGTADGKIYTDLGKVTDVKDRSYFKNIMNKGETEDVDDPVISKTTGKPIIHISMAITKGTKNIGFFCGIIGITELQNKINQLTIGNTGYAFLLASDGTVIAHKQADLQLNKNYLTDLSNDQGELKAVAQKMTARETGSSWVNIRTTDTAGKSQVAQDFIVYAPVSGTPWSLAVCVSKKQIYASANHLARLMAFISACMDLIIMISVGLIIYKMLYPLKDLNTSINSIATGNADLTKRIKIQSADEIGSVVSGFNTFTQKLQEIVTNLKKSKDTLLSVGEELHLSTEDTSASITQILANIESVSTQIKNQSGSVEETAGAVNEIASNITSLEKMIQSQSAGVTQASAAIEEMVGNISSVNESIQKMAQSFDTLQKDTQSGIEKQEGINIRILSISNQSKMLKEANQVIENIASQTNLLAMNAAIEAAHAGEAGKGFSVVADEIRKLSETSTAQSKTIGNELRTIEDAITEVVTVSEDTKNVFTNVSTQINQTGVLVEQIKSAMAEQHEGSKQINQALHDMNDGTSEVRGAAEEMSQGNKAILEEVKRLQDATEIMKDSVNEMSAGAKKINTTGNMLRDISNNMQSTIENIGKQVDLFKV